MADGDEELEEYVRTLAVNLEKLEKDFDRVGKDHNERLIDNKQELSELKGET